jgi:ABC-type nitrate/sulfonate/bicarbonate transport system substrate-binding protein
MFPTFAKLALASPRVTWQDVKADQTGLLLAAGQVDVIGTYVCDLPNTSAAVHGQPLNLMPYDRYIRDLFGTVLIARQQLIDQHDDLVRRVADAIVAGAVYGCQNPDDAGRIIQQALPNVNAGPAAEVYRLMAPYVGTPGTAGTLDEARVMRGIALLESAGIVKTGAVIPATLLPRWLLTSGN